MFKFRKDKKLELPPAEAQSYRPILTKLSKYLMASDHEGQALFINKLIELIDKEDLTLFVKMINTVDMWGGSGAVWEVDIRDKDLSRKFEREIINLIDLMVKTKISLSSRRLMSIKKFFEES